MAIDKLNTENRTEAAQPAVLKRANMSSIRKVIHENGSATRAEIVRETRISSTTVRTLLIEMLDAGEIESLGHDGSSGGRKAERYGLRADCYHGVSVCLMDDTAEASIVDVLGNIVKTTAFSVDSAHYESAVFEYLDRVVETTGLRVIGLGVPGVVDGDTFVQKTDVPGEWFVSELGELVGQRYGVPVVLENMLNAAAIGSGRICTRTKQCGMGNLDLAYVYLEPECVSAGLISDGKILRGSRNYAGEFGLVPIGGGRILDDLMSQLPQGERLSELAAYFLSWICGILNPRAITLAGPCMKAECLDAIRVKLDARLPEHMRADIRYCDDVMRDYRQGMAYLTACKMFDEVQFVKE